MDRSPLARPFPALPAIAGAVPRIARAGYKNWGRCDLTFVTLDEGTSVAGVFTKNVCCSSEVELGRDQVTLGRAQYYLNASKHQQTCKPILGNTSEHQKKQT